MENLFSYGTLQLQHVQLELFGRTLKMEPDLLIGYKKEMIKIKLESVVNLSGEEEHVIIGYTGNESDVIEGAVLSVTKDELEHADEYETDDYKRIQVTLKSGRQSWVYVKNNQE
jgi:gamma-glutamylcyclotransferase (GGCT)/AIG2-like uncharacterized protein YtfP